jgi:hypothetical protein
LSAAHCATHAKGFNEQPERFRYDDVLVRALAS